jgi:hypothetical protein
MLLGVIIPLIGYTICAVLLAIENGTRKELPEFISENHAYIAGIAFFCQLASVFSFGIKDTIRNFALCVLVAVIVGMSLYELFMTIRVAALKQHPSFRNVVEYCRNNSVTSVTVTHGKIEVSPGGKDFGSPYFSDRHRDGKGLQFTSSKELKRFAKMLARQLGFRCKYVKEEKGEWESSGGYKVSGNSIYAEGHLHTRILYEGYRLTPRK